MAGNEAAALITALALLIGAIVAYRKFGPESRKISVETVDINVKVAGENVRIASDLRDDAWEQWAKATEDIQKLRAEFDQYRRDTEARLAEMSVEVRAARAGEVEAKRQAASERAENKKLRTRVQTLEREVASLKANGST